MQILQGFLEALGMLAEGMDVGYEDLLSLIAEHELDKGASNEAMSKSQPRKSIQRQSIVAQVWRKPSQLEGSEISRSER